MIVVPQFWSQNGAVSRCLAPLGWLFDKGVALRLARGGAGFDPGIPVLCVGNLVLGGAGKTPVCLALADMVRGLGLTPHFLSRGYGGALKGPVLVDLAIHDAAAVGDEALLLARSAATWIGRDRIASARAAKAAGADCLILDDGFQDPSLTKSVALLVLDGGYGLGNGRVVPAGPLRETPKRGFAGAQACIVIGDDRAGVITQVPKGLPIFRASLIMAPEAEQSLRGHSFVAFAGIGRPEKFFDTLRGLDLELVATKSFPDHHPYSPADLEDIERQAAAAGARPITTAKDAVRLPPAWRDRVDILPIALHFEAPDTMQDWLLKGLKADQGTVSV